MRTSLDEKWSTSRLTALRENLDFGYVTSLPAALQRKAVYYEYARECPPIRDFVRRFQKVAPYSKGSREQEWNKLWEENRFADPFLVVDLICQPSFPKKPFKETLKGLLDIRVFPPALRAIGVSLIGCAYLSDVLLRKASGQSVDDLSPEGWPSWSECCGSSEYAIKIDWRCGDFELQKMFGELLAVIRPETCPGPPRAGRRGVGNAQTGMRDMLNQLVAYRLDAHGYTPKDAYEWTQHTNLTIPWAKKDEGWRKGWRKAVLDAEMRIVRMPKISLFTRVGVVRDRHGKVLAVRGRK